MFKLIAIVVIAIAAFFASFQVMEHVNIERILVVQSPISGKLSWYTTAGIKAQWFGRVVEYPKRDIYHFDIQVRFYDGGHAMMKGSVQYDMPLDVLQLTNIQSKYGSPEAVQKQLIETVVNKCVYMTGPTMTSKESYGEKRNDLIFLVEDQILNGVYKTTSKEVKIKDPLTGADKTVTMVEIARDKNGIPLRQEAAVLSGFGIKPFNFAIENLVYDSIVEAQIKQQQQLAMDVQTAIASAKKAEQQTLTVTEQGKAKAAEQKWEQEAIKAKAVVLAQQNLEVNTLNAKAAKQYKTEQILRAEGDAEYKKKVMVADGGLSQKLEAFVKVNELYAHAMENYAGSWVPTIVMGGQSGGFGQTGAQSLIDLLTAKISHDLSLDMSLPGKTQTAKK